MRIAIVDDLSNDRINLHNLISEYLEENKLSGKCEEFETCEEFLNSFNLNLYDVIFLDIIMDNLNGIEVAKHIRQIDLDIPIIFITVEKSYAFESYSVHAFDYLIKPFNKKSIFDTMDRIIRQTKLPKFIEIKESIDKRNTLLRRIAINNILYAEAQKHFVKINTLKSSYKTYMSFNQFLNLLPKDYKFQNCYRGIVVNLAQVNKLNKQNLILNGGIHIPISRNKFKQIQKAYADYVFCITRGGI